MAVTSHAKKTQKKPRLSFSVLQRLGADQLASAKRFLKRNLSLFISSRPPSSFVLVFDFPAILSFADLCFFDSSSKSPLVNLKSKQKTSIRAGLWLTLLFLPLFRSLPGLVLTWLISRRNLVGWCAAIYYANPGPCRACLANIEFIFITFIRWFSGESSSRFCPGSEMLHCNKITGSWAFSHIMVISELMFKKTENSNTFE